MTTLRGARETLGSDLRRAISVYPVLDYEPGPGDLSKPAHITVGVSGVTATEYQFAVRCYSDTSRNKPDTALDTLEAMIQAVEEAMPVEVPRASWNLEWSEVFNAYIGTTIAEYPRDDF